LKTDAEFDSLCKLVRELQLKTPSVVNSTAQLKIVYVYDL